MAIAHRVTSSNAGNPTTEFTIGLAVSIVADDILILSISNAGSELDPFVTDDDTEGNLWASLWSQANGSESGSVWWKRATSGTAGKTITVSSAVDSCSGTCSAYSGCITTGNPFENAASEANASADEAMAGITPTVDGTMVCLCVMIGSNVNITSEACTDPGALTQRGEVGSTGGGGARTMHASALQTTAAATGNFTWAMNNTTCVSFAFDLIPPAVAGGQPFHLRDERTIPAFAVNPFQR